MVLIDNTLSAGELGFYCIEAEWNQHDRILRVFVDSTTGSEAGVQMDDCVKVTKCLNQSSEVDDLVKGAYNLEVSSPGVERPIRLLKDFVKLTGSQVEVRLKDPVDGKRKLVGELSVSNDGCKLAVIDGSDSEVVEFELGNLLKANILYDWSK